MTVAKRFVGARLAKRDRTPASELADFCDSYRQLLDCIESKLAVLPRAAAAG